MSHKSLDTPRFHWCWKEFGSGNELLIAFPGFNRTPDDFKPFAASLGNRYTILAFELLFHGNSYVKGEPNAFTRDEFHEFISLVLHQYGHSRFSVMAFSFGGRNALNIIEVFADKLDAVYLMAPDAMRFHPSFRFATRTLAGRALFKQVNSNPGLILRLMRWSVKLGLYNQKAMDFFINQISFAPNRKRVYDSWMSHRKTIPRLKTIASLITGYKIPTLLFYGRYDTIIPARQGYRFQSGAKELVQVFIIDCGHRLPEKHHEIGGIILTEKEKT